jgi:hypothetical protein
MAKDKYVVYFGTQLTGKFKVVAKKTVKVSQSEVKYKDKVYVLDFRGVMFEWKGVSILLMNLNTGYQQYPQEFSLQDICLDINDLIVSKKFGRQFVSGIQTGMGFAWLQILVGVAIGAPVGFIIEMIIKVGL